MRARQIMNKEHGKLSTDQFRDLVRVLPEVRGQMKELPKLLQAKAKRLDDLLGLEFHAWGHLYELPFIEQLGLLSDLVGFHGSLIEASESPDPQERVIRWAADQGELDLWYEANKDEIERKYLVWLCIVLQRNILSIMLYHQSMGALVEHVHQKDDDAFFKAVRVDRTVLTCPTFANRLAKAELLNDIDFLRHLRSGSASPFCVG